MVTQGKELGKDSKQLGIEIDLGPEFQFHSIFSCPVSKVNFVIFCGK